MNLLIVGSILCLCLDIVNLEGELELLQGSRSRAKHKRRSKGLAKKRSRSRIMQRMEEFSYITSYNISSSVKGITCNNGVCHHYQTNASTVQGVPKWIMKIKNTSYFCFNVNVHLCPQFEGGKYKRFRGHERPPKGKIKYFEMVVCGKLYLCRATHIRLCPRVPIVESDWKEVTRQKAYVLRKINLIILCVAIDIEKCYEKYGRDNWVLENDVPDTAGVIWFVVIDGVKYYCKETEIEVCPAIEGSNHTEWKRYCNETETEECPKDNQWEQNVDGIIIICVAHYIEDCRKISIGIWVPSERGKKKNGTPKDALWVIVGVVTNIYCYADSPEKCPTLVKGGGGWRPVPHDEQDEDDESDNSDTKEDVSEWQLTVRGVIIICVAYDIKDCKKTHNGHWKPSDRDRDDNGVPEDTNWYIIVGHVKVYCVAKRWKSCPKLNIRGKKWERVSPDYPIVTEEPDIKNSSSEWQLKVKGVIIICVAYDIKDCKKAHRGHWKPSDRERDDNGVPEDTNWYIIVGHVKVYCVAKRWKSCPKLDIRGKKWERVSPERNKDSSEWQLTVKGVIIICVAYDIKDCKKAHRGHWKPSDRNRDDNGVPEDTNWYIIVGHVEVYCVAKRWKSCPKLNIIRGKKWERVSPERNKDSSSEWQQTVRGVIIICVAYDIKDCKKTHHGHWKPSDRDRDDNGVPEDTNWYIIVGHVKVYCVAKRWKSCPKLNIRGKKWERVSPDYPIVTEEPDIKNSSSEWQLKVKGVIIICVAYDIKDCKKAHRGHWKPSDRERDDNGVPEDTNWYIIVGHVKVYCVAKRWKSCPKLDIRGKKWERVSPERNKDSSEWQLTVKGVIIICVAYDIKDCKKAHRGHWKPSDREKDENGYPKYVVWVIEIGDVTAYCDAKNVTKCPKIKGGGKWDPLNSKQSHRRTTWDELQVDVAVIVPDLTEGDRFRQPQGDDTIILCYGKNADNCPDGGKWIKTKSDEVGEKVDNIITGKNVWVMKVRNIYVVCVAEDLNDCKPAKDEGWIIIGGMKAGLWRIHSHKFTIYCEAAEKSYCSDEVGNWVLISQDQWSQKSLARKKKGEMWRLVTFTMTIYCDAKYAGKCPKVKGHKWHKVFSNGINFDSYGTAVNFEKKIGKTYYCCKAKKKEACPELPNDESWGKIKEKVTLEVILIYFEDIVGFEDACRSDICPMMKEDDVFNGDDYDKRKRRKRKAPRNRNRKSGKNRKHRKG